MKITLATKITIARILLIIPTVVIYIVGQECFHEDYYENYLTMMIVSGVLFAICCSTDFIDGAVARKTGTVSDLGKLLDPLADKVVIVIMLFLVVLYNDGLSLGGVYEKNSLVIAILSGLIVSRELIIGVFRSIAARKNLLLASDVFGKIKTVFLDVSVTALMLAGLHEVIGWIGTVVFYLGAVLALFSGVRYIYINRRVLATASGDAEVGNDGENTDGQNTSDSSVNCSEKVVANDGAKVGIDGEKEDNSVEQ